MGRHCLTVLLSITKRKHLYPQYLSGASCAPSRASFSRPRIIPYRDQNPGSPTPSNAVIFSNFHPLACKSWLTIITCRSLLTVGRMIFWTGIPTLPLIFFSVVAALRNGETLRRLISQVKDLRHPGSRVPGSLAKPQRLLNRHNSLSSIPMSATRPKMAPQARRQKPVKLRVIFNPDRNLRLDECLVTILSWVAVGRSGAIGSRSPEVTGAIRRGVALVLPGITAVHAVRAARAAVVTSVIALAQTVYQASKLLLHDHDALLDDGVRLQVTGTLDLEVELLGDSVELEYLTRLGRFLKRGVLALRPVLLSILRDHPRMLAKTYHSCSALAPSPFPSNHRSVCPSLLCGSYSNPTAAVGAHFACSFAIPFFAMHVNFSS